MKAKSKTQFAGYYLVFGLLGMALMIGLGLMTNTAAASPPASQTMNAPAQANSPVAVATACTTNYTIVTTTGTIVPGEEMVTGSDCDDCVVPIDLPFSVNFYETSYTSLMASSNGTLQFDGGSTAFANTCLPAAGFGPTIFAYWDDLNAEVSGICPDCGIYTTVTGIPGSRIFYIEYRTRPSGSINPVNFEVVFYEADPNTFSIIYGQNDASGGVTVGVQSSPSGQSTQYVCNSVYIEPGTQLNFTQVPCVVETPTPTATNTPVPPTATPTPCQDRVTICHRTGNGGTHTITVSCDALAEHLSHGDTIGACPGDPPRNNPR